MRSLVWQYVVLLDNEGTTKQIEERGEPKGVPTGSSKL